MAKRTRTDLDSALGALIAPPTAATSGTTPRVSDEPERKTGGGTAEASGYERTSTGYRRDSGEVVRRLSLFLTEPQRRRLRRQAVDAGVENVTEYVVAALGLDAPRD